MEKQRSTKLTHKTKDRVTRTPLKTGGELRCSFSNKQYSNYDFIHFFVMFLMGCAKNVHFVYLMFVCFLERKNATLNNYQMTYIYQLFMCVRGFYFVLNYFQMTYIYQLSMCVRGFYFVLSYFQMTYIYQLFMCVWGFYFALNYFQMTYIYQLFMCVRDFYFVLNYFQMTYIYQLFMCVRGFYFVPVSTMCGRRGRHRLIVGFTTTCATSTYHH